MAASTDSEASGTLTSGTKENELFDGLYAVQDVGCSKYIELEQI